MKNFIFREYKIIVAIALFIIMGNCKLIAQVNYVRTWTATAPESNPNNLITRPLSDVKQVSQYYDGLGRPVQTVARQGSLETASGNNYDLVSMTAYDNFSRGNAQYLPYVATGTDGTYKTDAFTAQPAYYNNSTNPIAGQGENGSNAHTLINFETSPLSRPVLTMAPGNSWAGSSKGVQTSYWFNTANDSVVIWNVSPQPLNGGNFGTYSNAGYYAAGSLYKNIGNNILVYTKK